jgi:pyruvate,orthophosphate dikinase
MIAAQGVLTVHGGMTSHAAVVARGHGQAVRRGRRGRDDRRGGEDGDDRRHDVREGDRSRSTAAPAASSSARSSSSRRRSTRTSRRARLGRRLRRLKVRANADTPEDAAKAREFGAEGIGLCRTEHMFFGEERLPHVQEMIMAEDAPAGRPRSSGCCRCSSPTSRGSSRRWRACR